MRRAIARQLGYYVTGYNVVDGAAVVPRRGPASIGGVAEGEFAASDNGGARLRRFAVTGFLDAAISDALLADWVKAGILDACVTGHLSQTWDDFARQAKALNYAPRQVRSHD